MAKVYKEYGFDGYIGKPLDLKRMDLLLKKFLG